MNWKGLGIIYVKGIWYWYLKSVNFGGKESNILLFWLLVNIDYDLGMLVSFKILKI